MEITYIEMFSGVGGVRLGLKKANQISSDTQSRVRNEKGQCEPCVERGNGRKFKEFRYSSHKQIADSNTTQGGASTKKRSKSQLPTRYRCVWVNDNNKYACQIYRKHYGNKELVEANIKTINPNTIPDHTLLTAGFPCQAFSIAGKRKGFEDTRGTLFYDIARVAKAKRPKILLLENVKGLLSAQNGYCFYRILETLDELGYLVEWQVLNSKHFGVPQNRERVFIIGHLRGTGGRQIFPIGQAHQNITEASEEAQGERSRVRVANTLSRRYYKDGSENLIQINEDMGSQVNRVYSPDGLSPTVPTACGGRHIPKIVQPCLTPDRPKKRQHGRRFKEDGEPMFTLTGQDVHGIALNSKIRRLTPTECERLQGFPDGWTAEGIDETGKVVKISDTQRYKVLGNAVTTNVIEFLGKQLLSSFLGCAL